MKWSWVVWQVGALMAGVGAGAIFAAMSGLQSDAVRDAIIVSWSAALLALIAMTAARALDAGECVALASTTLGVAWVTALLAAFGAAWPEFADSIVTTASMLACGAVGGAGMISVRRLSATTGRARTFRNAATWLLVAVAASLTLGVAVDWPRGLLTPVIVILSMASLGFALMFRAMLRRIDLRRQQEKDQAVADPAMAGKPCSVRCPRCDSRVQAAAGARSVCACGVGVRMVALPRRTRFARVIIALGAVSALGTLVAAIVKWMNPSWNSLTRWEWAQWLHFAGVAGLDAMAASAPATMLWARRGPHWLAALSPVLNIAVSMAIAFRSRTFRTPIPVGVEHAGVFLAIAAAFWCVVLSRRRSVSRLRRPAGIAGFAAAAAGAAVLAWLGDLRADDLTESGRAWVYACASPVGIAAWLACASAYEPSLERGPPESAPPGNEAALHAKAVIRSACPSCGRERGARRGKAQGCRACGARWKVVIDEPQCKECGYLLYGLRQGACPECGREGERPEIAGAAAGAG